MKLYIRSIFLITLSLFSTQKPLEATVNKETLFATKKVIAAKLDPEGKKIAYIGSKEGRYMNLFITKDRSLEDPKQCTSFTDADSIQFFWVADGKKVLLLKDVCGKGMHHIFGVDITSGESRDYTKNFNGVHAKLYHISATENKAIIGLNQRDPKLHDLYTLDLDSGEITLLYENRTYQKCIFSDSLKIIFKIRVAEDGAWKVYTADDQFFMEIPVEETFNTSFLSYNESEKEFFMLDCRSSDKNQLKSISLDDSRKEKVYAAPEISDVDSVLFIKNKPAAYATYHVRKKWHVLDSVVEEDFAIIEKQLGHDFDVMSQDRQNSAWLLATNLPEIGPEIWLYDRIEKKLVKLHTEYPDAEFSKMYPLVVTAQDGMELVCYYTLPKKFDVDGEVEKPIPLVVFPHGGPFKVRECYSFNPYSQWLAASGYAVLLVNFRLSSGFGKAFVNAGNGQWGKKAHLDVLDAAKACVEKGLTSTDTMAIFGGSYGGYETLASCAFSPDFYSFDFLGPAISSITRAFRDFCARWSGVVKESASFGHHSTHCDPSSRSSHWSQNSASFVW